MAKSQNGKRLAVVVIREFDGKTLSAAFKSEAAATSFIAARATKGTELMASFAYEASSSWNGQTKWRYPITFQMLEDTAFESPISSMGLRVSVIVITAPTSKSAPATMKAAL